MEQTTSYDTAGQNGDRMVDKLARSAHQAVDRVADTAGPAIDRLRSQGQHLQGNVSAKVDELSELQEEWTASMRDYVRERPLTTIAIALVAGMALSRWLR